ncbi:MAG: glycosyltransferase family 39 protein [Verrucomicrobiota bacterium JB023]|nr:glycosyltransferase family 39 protein [Verrucomicrobiota bacterium JB023]
MRHRILQRLRFATLLALAWGGLVWAIGTGLDSSEPPGRIYEFPRSSKWIRVQDDTQRTGCFRKDFWLGSEVRHAWLTIACEGGWEVVLNGNPVGATDYWRATRPFQNGLTEAGQRAVTSNPSVAYNFPREYQWTGHANHRVPTFIDIRQKLAKGWNTLAVETEGRWTGVAFRLTGVIELENGETITLNSNETWKGEPVPKGVGQREWLLPGVSIDHWDQAISGRRFGGRHMTFVPRGMFERTFQGEWLIATELESSGSKTTGQDFVYEWEQTEAAKEAWVKVASRAPYMLYVNGIAVQPPSRQQRGLSEGGWMVKWMGRRPLEVYPTLLDPDETASALVGYRFENPSHGDPTQNDFKRYENTLNRTKERERATTAGELLDDGGDPDDPRAATFDPYGVLEEPFWRVPPEVLRERGGEQLHGFGILPIIKKGKNEIRLRVLEEPNLGYQRSRPVAIALDGLITGKSGRQRFLKSDEGWRSEWEGRSFETQTNPLVARPGSNFPQLSYIGEQRSSRSWKTIALLTAAFCFPILFLLPFTSRHLESFSLGFLATMALAVLVKFSLFERSEYLWYRTDYWAWVYLGLSLLGGLLVAFYTRREGTFHTRIPNWVYLTALLALCLFLRGYRVLEQPIDDDEYASIQAVVSIAETGVPEIGQGIWYSRSPGYHYLAGLAAWLFGSNLWVLRMLTVLTSVVTAWVVWYMARTYFHSRWIAAVATFFFAVHPFLIFTGHIARFYQQQQLFLLLLIDFFIRGFILANDAKWRVFAIFCFGAAVLSQEISISFVPILVVLYVLFGKDVNWRWEVKSIIAVAVTGAAIFIDILIFQMKCMTRPVGVSPNVEATISPNFWELGNLFAMFIGYSRLHVALSAFWLVSLLYSLKSGYRRLIALHVTLLAGILFLNLLITSPSFRYQYTLVGLWILLGCHGVWIAFELLGRWSNNPGGAKVLRTVAVIAIFLSWSPWRIPGSYEEKILGDPISGLRYVNAHWREGDKIMITEPHPHAAKMEVGQADYDLVVPILYDFTYSDNGLLRDRNGDAEVVNRVGKLQEVFEEDERIWILVNREKFRSRKRNLRWEYPTAREELYIRENCRLVYRSYLWHVYLWDQNLGKYHAFRKEPGGFSE